MHWSVQRVTHNLFSVSATSDGQDYTHVGNYRTVEDANRAGRRFVSARAHEQGRSPRDQPAFSVNQQRHLAGGTLHS